MSAHPISPPGTRGEPSPPSRKERDCSSFDRIPPFAAAVALAQAVEAVTREEFLDAQRRVRPGASYKGYAEGLWGPWKTGGLLWLACRTDPDEVAQVYALVVAGALAFLDDLGRDDMEPAAGKTKGEDK